MYKLAFQVTSLRVQTFASIAAVRYFSGCRSLDVRKNYVIKKIKTNTLVMYIWVYWTFSWILFQRLIKGQTGYNFPFIELTWVNAYEFCVLEGKRLMYSTHLMNEEMELEYLPWALAEYNISLITIWTIHKVNYETPKVTRSYENVPYTIKYNLDDLESVLCVYFVYEELKFSGWEADDCKNAAVVHHVLCADAVNGITAFPQLTFYEEKVVWTEAKKYCEYTNSAPINLFNELLFIRVFEYSQKPNFTSLISFWIEPPKYSNVTSSVVSDESICEVGVVRLISYELGFELHLSDEFELLESFFDCTYPIHAIMCEKQTEINPFVEMNNSMIVNLVSMKNISVSSKVECEEQCITLITYGIYCAGFNYNWTLQECSLLANLLDCTCYKFVLSTTEGMSAFVMKPFTITIGDYKPITEPGSTELRTQDNDNTDPMVTDQQITIGYYKHINEPGSTEFQFQDNANTDSMVTVQQASTSTTIKPTSTFGENAAGRLLTITMGLICTVSCVILIYKAAPILHQVKNMELLLADGKITRKEVEEQLNDGFIIQMSEEDGDRILTERVITLNIPPNCHMDNIN